MEFRPRVWPGVLIGGTGVALLVGLAGLLTLRTLEQPVSLVTFVAGLIIVGMVAGAGFLLYWTAGCARLCYHLDRNRLAIRWGWSTYLVPVSAISALLPGSSITKRGPFQGIAWPGHHVGHATVAGAGETVFLSAHLLARELIYLVTPTLTYAISVPDRDRFMTELRLRQFLGPSETVVLATEQPAWYDLPLWRDGVACGLLALALLGNTALFGYLCYAFPSLSELLPLRFTIEGVVEQVGWRTHILVLPATALVVLLINAVLGAFLYARERLGTYLCFGSAALVQVLVGAAVFRIVG